jgi:pimeloyl-ACP methyl ester carboxylesterase
MPFTENNGARIYWDEQGEGPPVLLIMGLGYPSDLWLHWRPAVASYRTIAFDNRGSGKSDVPPGPYSIRLMASDAAAVLTAAGLESAHIFGVSMGGMIAQEFALQYPHRVRSLILGCTQPGGRHAVLAKARIVFALLCRAYKPTAKAVEGFIPFLYHPSTPRERIEEDLVILKRCAPRRATYIAQLRGIFAWEAHSRLRQITAPTLVVHGVSDRLIPPRNGELIAAAIPGARLAMIPGAGHMFGTDQPELSQQVIGEFLAAVSKPQTQGTGLPRLAHG